MQAYPTAGWQGGKAWLRCKRVGDVRLAGEALRTAGLRGDRERRPTEEILRSNGARAPRCLKQAKTLAPSSHEG